jgi:hypothetical protein
VKTSELSDPRHPYWTAPRDLWLIARVPVTATYPCRCSVERTCNPRLCPCAGRSDGLERMPTICCARRAAEHRRRTAEPTPPLPTDGATTAPTS